METCFCSFFDKIIDNIALHGAILSTVNLLHGAAYMHPVDASSLHVCTNKWHPTASTLYPLSLPRK